MAAVAGYSGEMTSSAASGLPAPAGPNPSGSTLRVVVLGAGLSGLACARALADRGCDVVVLEKSRGAGGRAATRRDGGWRFDHGAQYFTVRDERFARRVRAWCDAGLVARWNGRVAVVGGGRVVPKDDGRERWVGVPGMSALGRDLATGLDVRFGSRVTAVVADGGGWRVELEGGPDAGRFDAVVVSAPAPQTAGLLAAAAPDLARQAAEVPTEPCWALMVGFGGPLGAGFDGGFVDGGPLSWIARNGSKPGRPDAEAWVVHASTAWSAAHLEDDDGGVEGALLDAFAEAVGRRPEPVFRAVHRWRFAQPPTPLPVRCLVDAAARVAACGDWCGGPRVEGAFLSGLAAADSLLGPVTPDGVRGG